MAKRLEGVEYIDIKNPKGETTETLTAVLYAPDGSIFKLCQGGAPLKYVAKGYKLKPDAIWQALHDELEKANAASLIRSDFDREIKERKNVLESQFAMLKDEKDMEALEVLVAAEEAKLQAELSDKSDEATEPDPSPADPEKPKTKPKTRRKAKLKAKG